jgi:hypothetical protein
MRNLRLPSLGLIVLLIGAAGAEPRPFKEVKCAGSYRLHLQGVCKSDDSLYWCFTDQLVKTDANGKIQKQIAVPGHHGDLCHHDGKIYVAVTLGRFRSKNEADSWVYVYKAEDLSLVTRYPVGEAIYRAGGIAYHDHQFVIVGGLPEGIEENYVFEYDPAFRFVEKHVLKSGYTKLGIQTAAFADGYWWFGCYGKPGVLLKAEEGFTSVQRFDFNCSVGIVPIAPGRFLVARSGRTQNQRYTGRLVPACADAVDGLRLVAAEDTRRTAETQIK